MRSVSRGCERGPAAQRAPPVLSREGQGSAQGSCTTGEAPKGSQQPPSPALPARPDQHGSCGVSGLTEGLLPLPNTATAPPSPRQKPPHQNKDMEGRKSPSQPWGLHEHSSTPSEGRGHRQQQQGFPEGCAVWPHVHGTCLPTAPLPAPQGSPAQPPVLFITQPPHVALRRGTDPSHTSSPPGAARTRALCLIRIRSSLLLLHFFFLLSSICIVLF